MDIKAIVEYWVRSAEEDYKPAQSLFSSGYYTHCLFFCHLVIEKILKAIIVKRTGALAPYEHNLSLLAEKTRILFLKEQLDLMDEINTFNIRGRYDDFKFEFHKKATKEYTEKYLQETTHLYL